MPSRPDPFPTIALRNARAPEAVQLFTQLVERAQSLADLQDQFLSGIREHRAAREGRPFRYSPSQRRQLAEFERAASEVAPALEHLAASMNDLSLVQSALASAQQELRADTQTFSSIHADDEPMLQRLLDHRRQTVSLIEEFLASRAPAPA